MNGTLSYWDRQLQFSEILPDYDFCRGWMSDQSSRISGETAFQRIPYVPAERQWFDLSGSGTGTYVPVFIHGGYWCVLDAGMHRFVIPGLSRLGPVQANVEYRLMPNARLDDLIDDVSNALKMIAEKTQGRLIVIGHSAGGHLALAGTRRAALGDRVAAIVPISGIFDLEPISWSFLQNVLALTPAEIASSPLRADHDTDPPTLIAVGARETDEYIRQAEAFSAKTGAPVVRVGGAHHMNVLASLLLGEAPLTQAISDFVSGQGAPARTEPALPQP